MRTKNAGSDDGRPGAPCTLVWFVGQAATGAVGHTQASTMARYSRGATGKSRKVAELRAAHRAAQNDV